MDVDALAVLDAQPEEETVGVHDRCPPDELKWFPFEQVGQSGVGNGVGFLREQNYLIGFSRWDLR